MSVDLYRSIEVADRFPDGVRALAAQGKPVAITEFGAATYLREVLEVFEAEGVGGAFVFAFALHGFPHRPDGDPRNDLDLASYGIVRVLEDRHGEAYPDMTWEPKAAFRMLADCYRGRRP